MKPRPADLQKLAVLETFSRRHLPQSVFRQNVARWREYSNVHLDMDSINTYSSVLHIEFTAQIESDPISMPIASPRGTGSGAY
jgi:hypothetical protein